MILEGMLSVKAALLAGRRKIHKIYIDAERKDREVRFVLHRAEERDVPVAFVSREEIENMTAGKTHGGIAAEAESRVYQDIGDCFTEDNVFLALTEGIEDPFNFGYILRTLYSGGCSGIITRRRNWENAESTILKSSAGALEYMNIVMTDDLPELIRTIKKKGVTCYAAMRRDAAVYTDADMKGPVLIAIGGEMRGLSSGVLAEMDQNIYIPYANDFRNALNAAAAAAVLTFEVVRQRRMDE